MEEFLNKVNNKVYNFYITIVVGKLSTIINKTIGRMIGIKIGSGLKTIGIIHFFRAPKSKIVIGKNCEFRSLQNSNLIGINRNCIVSTMSTEAILTIGNNCGFSGVSIGCGERIDIGSNCMIGANVIITDSDWHSLVPTERKHGNPKTKRTVLCNNVFIGVNTIILKGSYIGENSVIGAGSVVSGVIPSNVIAGGNPCKVIKQLS